MQYKKLIPMLKNKTYLPTWLIESLVTFNIDLYLNLSHDIEATVCMVENLNLEITKLRSYDGG